jgi:DNA-binding response OmpR family regulator
MLTARDAIKDRVQGLNSGADDCLVKPFAFLELLARVRAMSRRDPIERGVMLEVGDLRLDAARHQYALPLSGRTRIIVAGVSLSERDAALDATWRWPGRTSSGPSRSPLRMAA